MEEGEPASSGFLAGFRRMAETVLRTLQNRVELFALELQEEKVWVFNALLWAAATVLFGAFALLLFTFTCIVLSSDALRPYVMVGFCLLYSALAAGFGLGLRKRIHDRPPPLHDTVSELKKDIACLKSRETK